MRILLAVSGGIDSMTMADIIVCHSSLYEKIAVAHCNFHLRPLDCDKDEALVRDWCKEKGVEFFKKDFETSQYAASKGISIEMAARELRYEWFESLCEQHLFDAVAVAHNANDNAETLMLNLLRGTGIKGISGMGDRGKVVRPLLKMSREQIEAYALEHGVPYRTDKTNLETDCKRNKIRNEVFPIFKQLNPSFINTLNRDTEHFRAAFEVIEDWRKEKTASISTEDGRISIKKLLEVPHWEFLLHCILNDYAFNESTYDDLVRLLSDPTATKSGRVFYSKRAVLSIKGKYIFISSKLYYK